MFVAFFTGCSRNIPTPIQRLSAAEDIAKQNGLHVKVFKTQKFDIYAQYNNLTCKDIRVYIEGDGLAWITSSIISDNPTPINPLALKLMVQDESTHKLYLARPCQYMKNSICKYKYCSSHRFSQEVVTSYHQILDIFKEKHLQLFGYSGGGAIATLIAAQRSDVDLLVTIAGNLDTDFWTQKKYLTPLNGSLNPANFTDKLQDVQQIHLIGEKDNIIDESICNSYKSYIVDKSNITCKVYENFTHSCCWEKDTIRNFKIDKNSHIYITFT